MNKDKKIIIAGGGPAGLTAAYELSKRGIKSLVYERDDFLGGISRTAVYKGNRMDIGGHRFFSKSDVVMDFWSEILPTQDENNNPETMDSVMLKRSRLSRILWMRKLFNYPLSFSPETFLKLGLIRTFLIGMSYLRAVFFPIKNEKNLEEFFINRFGKKLYRQFFKDYTEKVWGVPCSEISSSWGAQRIKGVSIRKAILHALKPKDKSGDISQKDVETSLIDTFLYPKFGPGQMWETVAKKASESGAEVKLNEEISSVVIENNKVVSLEIKDASGNMRTESCDYLYSSMPIKELVNRIKGVEVPQSVKDVANGLMYRDFMTVGVLCSKINIKSDKMENGITKDNWIYVQESDVNVGRLQIFNNWSPYLVSDKTKIWMGLEYFCQEGDKLWSMPEGEMIELAKNELLKCGIISDKQDVIDAVLIRTKKAYPAYFGTYSDFDVVRKWLDSIENLYCIGRNGQHRYNNMDHSMLSAIEAVKLMASNSINKDSIWNVNSEESYHESK